MYRDLPGDYYGLVADATDVVLLETSKYDKHNHSTLLFLDPITTLQIRRISDVPLLFRLIEHYLSQGHYLAGYVSYECGYYFEDFDVDKDHAYTQPIAWFGVYQAPLMYDHLATSLADFRLSASQATDSGTCNFAVSNIRFDLTEREYSEKVAGIKERIRAGDTYQINFTGRYCFDFEGSSLDFYQALKRSQQTAYGAYIRAAGQEILCLSPELFFRMKDHCIVTRPMKGTAPRGRTLEEDKARAQWLQRDEKNRAENLMIVDLLRNDLGRICRPGSIGVPELFTIEQYATLFQMTSSVKGEVEGTLDHYQLFRSLFPSGSVTGAPKIRSMNIIRELEKSPRCVYCGAIGYLAPRADDTIPTAASAPRSPLWEAIFNVAIRTIVLRDGHGEMGVGSGIVYDSVAADEYQECMVKAKFVTESAVEFALLESILWDAGYVDLGRHLDRLGRSAEYFGFPYNSVRTHEALTLESARLVAGQAYKVRLTLDRMGALTCKSEGIKRNSEQAMGTIALCEQRTDSRDRFLYHKTTNRALYDRAIQQAREKGFAELIFLNEKGEVTEGARSNVFVRRNGRLLTPPIRCGLLNGTYRQRVLEERTDACEQVLYAQDLQEADEVFICNSIKGWRPVTFNGATTPA